MLLAREMLVVEPYKCKNRSHESDQAWDLIAANLNSVHAPRFRVSQKSVRDRATIFLKNFKLKIREGEKASGIEVEELSELDLALEEIIEKEKAANAQLDLEESVRKNELQDKANAEEMRLQATEKLGESKNRREASGLTAGDQKKKKARRSGSDTLDFMREKNGKIHDNEARGNGTKTVRAAKNARTTEQCVATDATTTGLSTTADAISTHTKLQNQTMLAIVEKFTKKD